MGSTEQAGHTNRRHRARQLRASIVALAQEYREACRQHEEIASCVFRLNGEAPDVLLDEEERVWEAMEQRREALFGALEEVEGLEGAGRGRGGAAMDEVMLTHACGCTQKMWVNVEGEERERYLAQLRAQDCTACQSPVEKATRAALRAAGPLSGTEKQMQWAEGIRRQALEGVYGVLESSKRLAAKHGKEVDDLDLLERGARALGTHTEARFWIDGRTRSPREWLVDAAYRVMAREKEQEATGGR